MQVDCVLDFTVSGFINAETVGVLVEHCCEEGN